jgi:hypothetical protein
MYFQHPPPKKVPKCDDPIVTVKSRRAGTTSESRDTYPCTDCASTFPLYHCDKCRARWASDQAKEREEELAKQRDYRERSRMRQAIKCACCGMFVRGKRRDARFCSVKSRQNSDRSKAKSTFNEIHYIF